MRSRMHYLSINAVLSEALFVSALQPSDDLSVRQIREAIARAVREFGGRGCAAQVAQEFGDHPEIAVMRMRWALLLVDEVFGVGRPESASTRVLSAPVVAQAGRAA